MSTKPQNTLKNRVVKAIKSKNAGHQVKALRGSYRASNNPRSRLQTPFAGSADAHVDSWSRRLARESARDMDRNADTFKTLMDAWQAAIAGEGVKGVPKSKNQEWNVIVAKAMDKKFGQVKDGLDARQLHSWYQMQGIFVRSIGVDGDGGLLKLSNGRLQGIESEQITNGVGNSIMNVLDGVALDRFGAVQYFNICPYSKATGVITVNNGKEYTPDQFEYCANLTRFSQTRGMPLLVSGLDSWERLDSYKESETIAAEQGAQIYGVIERIVGDQGFSKPFAPNDSNTDPSEVIRGGFKSNGDIDWQPTVAGCLMELPNGAKYVPVDPKRPNRDACPFIIELLRQFCAVAGLPYEIAFNDLRGLSWSINRALVAQARDRIRILQKNLFAPTFSNIYLWQLAILIEEGEIPAVEDWEDHDLLWPELSWPDEGKEYEAQNMGLKSVLTTRHKLHGPVWREILDERAIEMDYAAQKCSEFNAKYPDFKISPFQFLGEETSTMKIAGVDQLSDTTDPSGKPSDPKKPSDKPSDKKKVTNDQP